MAAIANPARECTRALACDARQADALRQATSPLGREGLIEFVDRDALEGVLPAGAVHQGVALAASPLPDPGLNAALANPDAGQPGPVVVLDQVTDPQNIGAIIRSAAAFGAAAVVVQDRHAPPVTGALAKAASGGLERVPLVRETNLARVIDYLKQKGFWCIGLDGDAEPTLSDATTSGRMALVLGAEGRGLRRLVAESCDALARIPQTSAVESLNVSNAAAVALYELTRAR